MLTADDEDTSDDFFPRFNKSHHVFDTSWSTSGINIYTAGGAILCHTCSLNILHQYPNK